MVVDLKRNGYIEENDADLVSQFVLEDVISPLTKNNYYYIKKVDIATILYYEDNSTIRGLLNLCGYESFNDSLIQIRRVYLPNLTYNPNDIGNSDKIVDYTDFFHQQYNRPDGYYLYNYIATCQFKLDNNLISYDLKGFSMYEEEYPKTDMDSIQNLYLLEYAKGLKGLLIENNIHSYELQLELVVPYNYIVPPPNFSEGEDSFVFDSSQIVW
jgi:hypothetical protein